MNTDLRHSRSRQWLVWDRAVGSSDTERMFAASCEARGFVVVAMIFAGARAIGVGRRERPALVVADLDPDADPPKVLAIGPDLAGNLLEVVWLELAGGVELVIHAMGLRPAFYDLLRSGEDPTS